MAQNFAATVDDWVSKSKEKMEAVFKTAVEATIEDMQTPVGGGGNMPIDTGFLRASKQESLNTPILRQVPRPKGEVIFNTETSFVIAGAELGDTIYATYGANYAVYVEYKRGFVRLAAQNWQTHVNAAVSRLSS